MLRKKNDIGFGPRVFEKKKRALRLTLLVFRDFERNNYAHENNNSIQISEFC